MLIDNREQIVADNDFIHLDLPEEEFEELMDQEEYFEPHQLYGPFNSLEEMQNFFRAVFPLVDMLINTRLNFKRWNRLKADEIVRYNYVIADFKSIYSALRLIDPGLIEAARFFRNFQQFMGSVCITNNAADTVIILSNEAIGFDLECRYQVPVAIKVAQLLPSVTVRYMGRHDGSWMDVKDAIPVAISEATVKVNTSEDRLIVHIFPGHGIPPVELYVDWLGPFAWIERSENKTNWGILLGYTWQTLTPHLFCTPSTGALCGSRYDFLNFVRTWLEIIQEICNTRLDYDHPHWQVVQRHRIRNRIFDFLTGLEIIAEASTWTELIDPWEFTFPAFMNKIYVINRTEQTIVEVNSELGKCSFHYDVGCFVHIGSSFKIFEACVIYQEGDAHRRVPISERNIAISHYNDDLRVLLAVGEDQMYDVFLSVFWLGPYKTMPVTDKLWEDFMAIDRNVGPFSGRGDPRWRPVSPMISKTMSTIPAKRDSPDLALAPSPSNELSLGSRSQQSPGTSSDGTATRAQSAASLRSVPLDAANMVPPDGRFPDLSLIVETDAQTDPRGRSQRRPPGT